MAIKIQNVTNQVVPVIVPGPNGGTEIRLAPRQIVVLATEKTDQLSKLENKGIIKIRK